MNLTLEVRLFDETPLPIAVAEFFAKLNPGLEPVDEQRSDVYLAMPNCKTVGVKARGGSAASGRSKLEVKALREPIVLGPTTLFGHAVEVERWGKWSYAEPAVDPLISAIVKESSGEWVRLEKRRSTRKFARNAAGEFAESDARERPDAATNVELVEVTALGRRFWGVGLETFGPETMAKDLLLRTLAHFSDPGLAAFQSLRPLSYAGLVSTFAESGGL